MITTINVTSSQTLGAFSTTRILCLVSTASGNVTLTLESATKNRGQELIIKHVTAGNTLTVSPQLGETVSGGSSYTSTTAGDVLTLVSDGSNYVATASTGGWVGTATSGLDMGGFNITNVGTVDGVDVSTLNTTVSGHLDGGANKHDASEIDVETARTYLGTTVNDLEDVLGELDTNLNYRIVVETSAGMAGIGTAATTITSGKIQLKKGTYSGSAALTFASQQNLIIEGVGPETVLQNTTTGDWIVKFTGPSTGPHNLSGATENGTSVTCSTASQAGNYAAGDIVQLRGFDPQSNGDAEVNEVVSADSGTGVVTLKWPIKFTLTSATIRQLSSRTENANITLRNLTLKGSQSVAANGGVLVTNGYNIRLENVSFETFDTGGAVKVTDSADVYLDVNIRDCDGDGVLAQNCHNIQFSRTTKIYNTGVSGSPYAAIRFLGYCFDCEIVGTTLRDSHFAIYLNESTDICRRVKINHNNISTMAGGGIICVGSRDCTVIGNVLNRVRDSYTIYLYNSYSGNNVVNGNIIHDVEFGIAVQSNQVAGVQTVANNSLYDVLYQGIVLQTLSTSSFVNVVGNNIKTCGSIGIVAQSLTAGKFANNTVVSATRGISLVESDKCTILGNHIQSCTSEHILLGTACTANQVAWNYVDSGTITDNGTSNVVSFNL